MTWSFITPIILDSLVVTLFVWYFQVRFFYHTKTTCHLISSNSLLPVVITKSIFILLLPNILSLIVYMFTDDLLTVNHVRSLSSS